MNNMIHYTKEDLFELAHYIANFDIAGVEVDEPEYIDKLVEEWVKFKSKNKDVKFKPE